VLVLKKSALPEITKEAESYSIFFQKYFDGEVCQQARKNNGSGKNS